MIFVKTKKTIVLDLYTLLTLSDIQNAEQKNDARSKVMGEGVYSHAIFGRIRKHPLQRSWGIRAFPTGYPFYGTINYIFEHLPRHRYIQFVVGYNPYMPFHLHFKVQRVITINLSDAVAFLLNPNNDGRKFVYQCVLHIIVIKYPRNHQLNNFL